MKSGIYYVIGYKLVRDNTYAEIVIGSELKNKTETILIPITPEEINEIKSYNYIVWFKPNRSSIIVEKYKTSEEAQNKLFQLQTYYTLGVTL